MPIRWCAGSSISRMEQGAICASRSSRAAPRPTRPRPRGLMPNPKVGTVTMDIVGAVKASKGGAVEFRVEKAGIVQGSVGKASFTPEKLVENIAAFVDAVAKAKPQGAKGTYIQRVAISSTMGPGVKIDPATITV